ncbi:predicted protein [Chaetoceros tenuissimus]|uniref:Uncharacterized protein n=1 Tax=Chaetoceros tenuissimus TaxID=426638 RepID=A0AAD3CEF8_9STRA|nr:predicted protein [Chaetoceros tenuissimus]
MICLFCAVSVQISPLSQDTSFKKSTDQNMDRTNHAAISSFARRRKNLVDRCSKDVDRTQHAYKVYNVANTRKPYPSSTPQQKKKHGITKKETTSAPTSAHVSIITDPLKLGIDFEDSYIITASSSNDSIVSEVTIPVDIRGYPYEKRSNKIKKMEYSVNTYAVNDKKERFRTNLKRDDQNKENTSHREVLKAVRQQYRDQVFDRLANDAKKVAFRKQLALALNQS